MAAGRPSIYTEELADRICAVVATNPHGLPTLCRMFDFMPNKDTINVWRWEKPEFSVKYTRAKQQQAELMAESSEDIIAELEQYEFTDKDGAVRLDAGMIARARLLIDTRKWHASKLAPKIYGTNIDIAETIDKSHLKEIAERVAQMNKESEKEY